VVAEPFHPRLAVPEAPELVGRAEELSRLTTAISDPPRGRTVVVSGRVGAGKSLLLDIACRYAESAGFRVVSIAGDPGESHTPFAGVHQLIHALGQAETELERYQGVIDAELRSAGGDQLDTVRVAMALLNLLDAVEKRQPVLVSIDDGHWLDEPSRSAMMFAARRSGGRLLTIVLAIPATAGKLPIGEGHPIEIALGPLSRDQASVLLDQQPVPPQGLRREHILTAAAGNPAAIIAFAAAAADDLTAGPANEPLALPAASHGIYSRRVALLPRATREALLVLAAAADQDLRHLMPGVVVDAQTLAPAEVAGFVRVESGRVRFVDPLIRSAAYHRVPAMARSAAHGRLAEALAGLPHRQVWHRAAAALKPDEALAAQLEGTCDEVLRRDGYAAAAVIMWRAAMLSTDLGGYTRRMVQAAPLARHAGDVGWAAALSRCALNSTDNELHRIKAHTELGSAICWGASAQSAVDILLSAADSAIAVAPVAAWEPLRVAASVTFITDDPAARCGVARGLRLLEDAHDNMHDRAATRIWIRTTTDLLRAHLEMPDVAGLAVAVSDQIELTAVGASAWLAGEPELALRCLRGARTTDAGPSTHRFGGMSSIALSWACVDSGRWDEAVDTATEMSASAAVADWPVIARVADLVIATVAARRGQTSVARERLPSASALADSRDQRGLAAWMHHAAGSIALAENHNTAAYAELAVLFDESGLPLHVYASYLALPDYAEAAVLTGRIGEAREQLARILDHLPRPLSPRLSQLVAHAHAVLNPDTAGARYSAALADPAGNRWPFERARLHISYAGWLRRHRRRRDSQHQLATALTVMQKLGAAPWVDLCTRELRAAGVRPHPSSVQAGTLSSQEHNVVYLVSEGYTNPQIAAILNLSVRTVSNHLYRSFPKLGVTSRHQIHDVARPPAWAAGAPAVNC
jgi:DNA-binding CsgD family transcriptional regulator